MPGTRDTLIDGKDVSAFSSTRWTTLAARYARYARYPFGPPVGS
ncbi:hypothetical protein [Streptomyces sp. NPDC008092]